MSGRLTHIIRAVGRQEQTSSNYFENAPMICVHNFAQRWDISPELLEAQIPAITKLKSLADPPPKPNPAPLVGLGIVAATVTFFLLGVLGGLVSVGYHLVGGR